MVDRITALAKNGAFGDGKFLRVIDKNADAGPQFASQLKFFAVELEKDSKIVSIPMVSKIQPKTEYERRLQNSDNQFFAEVIMYSEVLPLIGGDEIGIFPKFIYGKTSLGKDSDNDIVVVKDLTGEGFRTSKEKVFLPANTVKLTVRKLGEFHGLSYRAKKTHINEQLQSLASSLPHKTFHDDFDVQMMVALERGFRAARLTVRGDLTDILDRALKKIKEYRPAGLWKAMLQPEEPYAVIVHGDFNRNNLLYKYSNDEATDVRFLDFQSSSYSDPSVDLAFILYMNTNQEMRAQHMNEFLQTYWEGLTSIEPNPGFSQEEFFGNFSSRALYGYLPCSFFLPSMMMDSEEIDFAAIAKMTTEEKAASIGKVGGEECDNLVSDIVEDLLERGYLEKFLLNFK